ncbi:MAG: beta-ketoacyl synthase chain length factor [Bacteroidales bacterium]
MAVYIKEASAISPQNTFGSKVLPAEVTAYTGVNMLRCIEPVYRDFIDPMVSRRMSRIVKMGVCCAMKCLRDSGIDVPDAIIAGTGLGCLEDTEKFLGSIYANEEKLLNPTPFIQSTHNTVAGAIALAIKCHNYNATYTHRGFSFESALEDALLHLAENPGLKILTGGFDEVTPGSYEITRRMGLWKNHPVSNMDLGRYHTRGSMPGEGVAFFMLSGEKSTGDWAAIRSLNTFCKPSGKADVAERISNFIAECELKTGKPDLVIYGKNGDTSGDGYYDYLINGPMKDIPHVSYKNLCGEYDTSASFALWLAALMIREQRIPSYLEAGKNLPVELNHVLIYNHLRGVNHSLYLLERC